MRADQQITREINPDDDVIDTILSIDSIIDDDLIKILRSFPLSLSLCYVTSVSFVKCKISLNLFIFSVSLSFW